MIGLTWSMIVVGTYFMWPWRDQAAAAYPKRSPITAEQLRRNGEPKISTNTAGGRGRVE